MKTNVISIDSKSSIEEAAIKMSESNIGSIIITQKDTPVGIVTERDIVTRAASKDKSFLSPVAEIMSSPLKSIGQDEIVWEAAEIMKTQNIHKLPVLKDGKLVGIVTNTDIVALASLGSDSEMRKICDQIFLLMKS